MDPAVRQLLERIAVFGAKPYPKVSDLEAVIGPVFVDVDSSQESTLALERPPWSERARPFLYVEVTNGPHAGKALRICAHAPVTFGRLAHMRLVLTGGHRDGGVLRLMADGTIELAVAPSSDLVTVRGASVPGTIRLAAGDEISCGTEVLRIREHPGWPNGERFSEHVAALSASLGWDVHHERMHDARDRNIERLTLHLALPLEQVVSVLEAPVGGVRLLEDGEVAMDPFYAAAAGDATRLQWQREVPDRALDELDAPSRERLLRDLFAALPTLESLEAIAELVAARVSGAGVVESEVRAAGGDRDGTFYDFTLRLRPPLDARELCRIAGWAGAFAEAEGMHMSAWSIVVGDRYPRVGPWIVNARLTRWPRRVDGTDGDARDRYDLVDHTSGVEWIHVRAPRRDDR